MARAAAAGISDFAEIIEKNCFYVDKTDFIKEWWENEDKVTLITRPRRFGKTLTMSMVEHFFSIKYAGRGDLFCGLGIWKEEKYRQLQGTYPVISLSFSNIKGDCYENARRRISQVLTELYAENVFLLDSGILTEQEKAYFKTVADDMDHMTAARAVRRLSEYLARYYGRRVIILLDEYDTLMQEAYIRGYWDELTDLMRDILGDALKDNSWLERGIMTGITRISKESLFSGLNNLTVITSTSDKYASVFGFTEDEVLQALEEFGLQQEMSAVKEQYDGFCFGRCSSIYNPWSVTQFLDKRKLKTYWVNTSSNNLVNKLIREGSSGIKRRMEDLLNGKSISVVIDEEITFEQLDFKKNAVWSLLLASGYLKTAGIRLNRRKEEEYILELTNLEVRRMFDDMFIGWFFNEEYPGDSFSDALLSGDRKLMTAYLNDILMYSISYYDSGKRTSKFKLAENFYHGLVLGLIAELRYSYAVTSNRESGFGRYEVMLEPLCAGDDAVILEFKVYDPDEKEKKLEDTARAAVQQILEKEYAAALEAKGIGRDRIRIYGFAFEGKRVLIEGGPVRDYETGIQEE